MDEASATVAGPEARVLALLRSRNRAAAPSLALARAHELLLAECTALEATSRTCERLQREAMAAKAAEAQAADAAQLVGDKLADAQARVAELEHDLQQMTAREAETHKENETLLARLTEQLQMRAMAMDTEREEFEAAAAAASSAEVSAAATSSADAPEAGAASTEPPVD